MRCKEDDMAMIIRSVKGNEGKIVRVAKFLGTVEFASGRIAHDCWGVEAPGVGILWWRVRGFEFDAAISDSWLRPLRDPGDDAQDETLLWKPVPTTTKETA